MKIKRLKKMVMFFKYLRWSNFKISIDFNPFTWNFRYISEYDKIGEFWFAYLRVLPLSFLLVLDEGIYPDEKVDNPV